MTNTYCIQFTTYVCSYPCRLTKLSCHEGNRVCMVGITHGGVLGSIVYDTFTVNTQYQTMIAIQFQEQSHVVKSCQKHST